MDCDKHNDYKQIDPHFVEGTPLLTYAYFQR